MTPLKAKSIQDISAQLFEEEGFAGLSTAAKNTFVYLKEDVDTYLEELQNGRTRTEENITK